MPIAQISGVARPTQAFLKRLGRDPREAQNVLAALDGAEAVDGLARLLTEGMDKCATSDGRLDTRDLAAYVINRMKENQR